MSTNRGQIPYPAHMYFHLIVLFSAQVKKLVSIIYWFHFHFNLRVNGRRETHLTIKKCSQKCLLLLEALLFLRHWWTPWKERCVLLNVSGIKHLFMRYRPKTMCTTLEAAFGRRDSLPPTGTRVYLQLQFIGLCQISPIILSFFLHYFYIEMHSPSRKNASKQSKGTTFQDNFLEG